MWVIQHRVTVLVLNSIFSNVICTLPHCVQVGVFFASHMGEGVSNEIERTFNLLNGRTVLFDIASLQSKCLSHFGHIAHMTTWHLRIGHDVAMMWSYIYDHTIMTLQKTRYSHMTNHMSRNVTLFLLVWPTIWPNDHHMTNMLSPIWPIHDLTIIWPTHFWSMHMTNDMAKIFNIYQFNNLQWIEY